MPNIHTLTDYLEDAPMGIDPDAYTATAYTSTAIDAQNYAGGKALFIVHAGELGASATLDFKAQDCATIDGSFVDIVGAAITQLTQAGTDESDTVVLLEVDIVAGRPFLKGILTIGVATSDAGVECLLYNPRSK